METEKNQENPDVKNPQEEMRQTDTTKNYQMEKNRNKIGVEDLVPIESDFDVDEYVGKQTTIEMINIEYGNKGHYLKVETAVLKEIPEYTEGETGTTGLKPVRASKLFNVKLNKDQILGWTPKSNLANFLKKYHKTHPKDLKGVKVIIDKRVTDTGEFLTFV